MSTTLDIQTLYEALRKKLGLHWVSGKPHGKRIIHNSRDSTADLSLVGHLNLIRPNRVQILGATELQHLERLDGHQYPGSAFQGPSHQLVVVQPVGTHVDDQIRLLPGCLKGVADLIDPLGTR